MPRSVQHRSTQRKIPRGRADEVRLTADIVELVRQYGRYGYRKIAELLRRAGCRTCSSCGTFPSTLVPTTARSSSPRRCRTGSALSVRRPLTSSPGPWENGFIESFDARRRDELLNGDIFLHTARGADRHRELAAALQHCPAACLGRLSRTCPGSVRASGRRMAGCATSTRSAGHVPAGATADAKLTFQADHLA